MYLGLIKDSPFPIMTHDVLMRQALADREEIRFMAQSNGTTVCSYIVAGADTFNDVFAREARGIVFDATGKIIARPLHKFFNVNERPETQLAALKWSEVVRVMLKRDGSMIHTVAYPEDGRVFTVKSKKSFESDVAKQSKQWLLERPNYVKFCTELTLAGKTAIFEWTSPTARIVIGYKEESLTLLHVRDNETGVYASTEILESLAAEHEIPLVEDLTQDFLFEEAHSLPDAVASVEGLEGWVFQFKNGEMVKLKTKWYMDRHHAMTFLRIRDIARMVVDESLDDLKAKLVGDGIDIAPILEIERKVVKEIDYIIEHVELVYETNKHLERKEFAILMKGHQYFGLLMHKYSGKEPDFKGFFEKHYLDEMFDLTQINLTDSVAEVE